MLQRTHPFDNSVGVLASGSAFLLEGCELESGHRARLGDVKVVASEESV